jgi:DNA modification methylase
MTLESTTDIGTETARPGSVQRFVRRQFGDCLLIHADWKQVIETLPTVAAVVTDPPYGIGKWSANSTGGYMTKDEADATSEWDEAPTREDLLKLAALGVCVMWGGNYLDLPPCRTPLVWDKDQKGMHFAEVEIAWTNFVFGSARILACPIKKHETFGNKCHPTQKPIRVMSWSVQQTRVEMGQTVLDPYMGSGTTGIACIRTGHKFIGIEKDKRHFETACERIERELSQGVLLPPNEKGQP